MLFRVALCLLVTAAFAVTGGLAGHALGAPAWGSLWASAVLGLVVALLARFRAPESTDADGVISAVQFPALPTSPVGPTSRT